MAWFALVWLIMGVSFFVAGWKLMNLMPGQLGHRIKRVSHYNDFDTCQKTDAL